MALKIPVTQTLKVPENSGQIAGRRMISLAQIVPGVYQPRQTFRDESIQNFHTRIRQHGISQYFWFVPILNFPGTYEIVTGERRWRCCSKSTASAEVPVIIRDLDDTTTLEIALIENLQREDLNAVDEARALRQLADQFEYTHEQVAEKVGKSRSYVANMFASG